MQPLAAEAHNTFTKGKTQETHLTLQQSTSCSAVHHPALSVWIRFLAAAAEQQATDEEKGEQQKATKDESCREGDRRAEGGKERSE